MVYTALDGRMTVSDEKEKFRKEIVVTYSEVMSQHLPEGTEKNHENNEDTHSRSQGFNPQP
jgi:hypothetical protein